MKMNKLFIYENEKSMRNSLKIEHTKEAMLRRSPYGIPLNYTIKAKSLSEFRFNKQKEKLFKSFLYFKFQVSILIKVLQVKFNIQ